MAGSGMPPASRRQTAVRSAADPGPGLTASSRSACARRIVLTRSRGMAALTTSPCRGWAKLTWPESTCHKAGLFQVVDDVSGVCSEVVALERFTEREHLDNGAGLGREIADPVLHQIEQPACARQPVIQVPHAGPVDKRSGLDGAKHEFTHVERIAPGDPPELLSGACLHGTAEGQVKERVETGGAEIGEVEPRERAVPNQVS